MALKRARGVSRLSLRVADCDPGAVLGDVEQGCEIEVARLPVVSLDVANAKEIGAADNLVEPAEPELGHQLAHFFRHEEHEVHHVVGKTREARPQLGVLGSNPHRAGVQVAHPGEDAARGDEGSGPETESLRTEQRRD